MAEKKEVKKVEPLFISNEETEKEQPAEKKYLDFVGEIEESFKELEKYFKTKLQLKAETFPAEIRYPIADFDTDFNAIKGKIQQEIARLKILPDGIDKAVEKCDNLMKKRKRIKDF